MKVVLLAVGNVKEKYMKNIIDEKVLSFSKNGELEIIEIKEERDSLKGRNSDIINILDVESDRILEKLKKTDYVVSLAIEGKFIKKGDFKKLYYKAKSIGKERIVFIIGSSNGLSKLIKKRSDKLISLSAFTMPHQLVRCALLSALGEINE